MNETKDNRFNFLSNLKRSELEASYRVIYKENTQLKKALQQQFNETNCLRCQLIDVLNLLNFKKLLRPSIPVNQQEKCLQLYVQLLNEKISVLTHQLLNHSRFHTEVHKCYRGTTQFSNFNSTNMKQPFCRHAAGTLNNMIGDTAINSNHEKEKFLQNYPDEEVKNNNEQDDNIKTEEIKVAGNIDIIRLKILIKRLTIQNATLSHHVDSTDKETFALRKELEELQTELDELSKQANKEKEKYSSVSSLVVELSHLRQRNKILLEEIREMQEEKEALKDAYQKLLEEINDINENLNPNINPPKKS